MVGAVPERRQDPVATHFVIFVSEIEKMQQKELVEREEPESGRPAKHLPRRNWRIR